MGKIIFAVPEMQKHVEAMHKISEPWYMHAFNVCVQTHFGDHCKFLRFEYKGEKSEEAHNQSRTIFGTLVYASNGEREWKEMAVPIVCKRMPEKTEMQEENPGLGDAYVSEMNIYARVIAHMAKVDPSVWRTFPRFYYAGVCLAEGAEKGMLLLEDLEVSGYRLAPKKSFLDLRHLKLMLGQLGRWHAFSYEAKRRDFAAFKGEADTLRAAHHVFGPIIPDVILSVYDRGMVPLQGDPKYGGKLDRLRDIMRDIQGYLQYVLKGQEEHMAVVYHGDFLRNNVFFKYDENGEPIRMKMIDLACAYYASPIVDLALCLYMNCDQQTRSAHWDELLASYYDSLKGTFPENHTVPTMDDILKEFRAKGAYAYFMCSFFLPHLMAEDAGDSRTFTLPPEYRDKKFQDIPIEVMVEARKKIGGTVGTEALVEIVKDMIDRGFL